MQINDGELMPAPSQRHRVAVLSHVLPPSSSGQAVVLYRLLHAWDPARYCLISRRDYVTPGALAGEAVTARLPATYHHLPRELGLRVLESGLLRAGRGLTARVRRGMRGLFSKSRGQDAAEMAAIAVPSAVADSAPAGSLLRRMQAACFATLQGWDDWLNLRFELRQRVGAIERVLRQEKCTALVACSGDLLDLPAGFFAARRARVPYYSYMFDDYEHQWTIPSARRFARRACPYVIGQAAGVIVPNEFLANAYREAYRIEPTIVRNPVAEIPRFSARGGDNRPFRIVFTGAIYEAHLDAFTRMIRAVARIAPENIEFHIYTNASPSFLARHGIGAPAIRHPAVSNAESLAIQQAADLLFLPLAFSSPYPRVINTSAPGKMGEYLASSRAVLVHAPAESFLSWYCRRHACAAVVDVPDVDAVYEAVLQLLRSSALRNELAQRAWERAGADFALPVVCDRFAGLFAAPSAAQVVRLTA